MDGCWRAVYRIGFRLARLWWWLLNPDHHGVLIAIWLDGRILAIRQSYRSDPTWPGGGLHRGEDPREAACRELAEEVGLVVGPDELIPARRMIIDWDFRRDHVSVFELHLKAPPLLMLDNREVVGAQFVEPRALLTASRVSPIIRAHLEALGYASRPTTV
jgi:8-oxo-dGTP pyrophosphatase MutT (NUDIX family)